MTIIGESRDSWENRVRVKPSGKTRPKSAHARTYVYVVPDRSSGSCRRFPPDSGPAAQTGSARRIE